MPSPWTVGLRQPQRCRAAVNERKSARNGSLSGYADAGSRAHPANGPTIPPHLVAAGRLRDLGKLPLGDTMKTVKITEILDYYDGILAFVAQDPIGGHYVGSIIGRTSENDRYLVVGARPERLDDLRNGKVDLRALLLETPDGEWYVTIPEGTIDDPMELVPQSTPLADSDHLPGHDYFLGPRKHPTKQNFDACWNAAKPLPSPAKLSASTATPANGPCSPTTG